jgi:predicted negative regulator of RcsB-dependent stress response
MGWLITLIVLALLGVGGWFAFKRFGGKKPPASSPASPAQPAASAPAQPQQPAASPIRKFISAQKGQGLSNEQIRTKLRGKGWRDGDIDRYMNASRA